MLSFEYYNPVKLIYGVGETERIGELAAEYGKRALIVSYANIDFYGGLFPRIHAKLEENGVYWTDCLVATPNPKLREAKKAIELGKEEKADLVIGVGGGSVMDLAKITAAGILYPNDLKRMIKFSHADDSHIPPKEALPTIMLPTLPATASEMNPTAVITDEETLRKSYVWEPACLYPKASILDPELTKTLPAYQTACGGLDAISHAAEPFLFSSEGRYGNITLQSNMQMAVIRTIYDNLPLVLRHPEDLELRGLMQFSATVGLNGWLTCGVQGWTPMHQTSHVLSSHFKATHGASLACMMLAWMRFFACRPDNERFIAFAEGLFGTRDILEAADRFEAYIRSVGVQSRISEFGCNETDLDELTQGVVDVSFGPDGTLASVPPVTREEVREIYRLAL